jgi:hypothetical protein
MSNWKIAGNPVIRGILSSLVLIVSAGALITVFTAVSYARTCEKLTGFPGLLQRVGLVAAGPCVTKLGGVACGGGNACTTAQSKPGTCKNIAAVGQAANCQCVANTVTNPGLR